MEIRKINNFNNYTEINPANHSESKLYRKDNELIKILYNSFLTDERRKNILLLENLKHPNCVIPNYAIKNKKDKIQGYSMDYLDGYITLTKYLKKQIPFEERKKLAHKICQIMNELKELEYSYTDVHSYNFLINDIDIKLVDMDSGRFKSLCKNDSFEFRCEYVTNYISELCYQILLGMNVDFRNDVDYYAKNKLLNSVSKKQNYFLNHAFDNKFGYFDPEEYIDYFDETTIQTTIKLLNLKRKK